MKPRYSVFIATVMGAVALAALVASGCTPASQSDLGRTVDSTAPQMQKDEKAQQERIRNNPNIPAQAQEAALKQREMAKKGAMMANGQAH